MRLVGVSHSWMPEVLVQQRNALLNGRREISVVGDQAGQASPGIIINLVQNNIDSLLKLTLGFAIDFIKHTIELDHRVLAFGICPFVSISHQFKDSILHQHNCHFFT